METKDHNRQYRPDIDGLRAISILLVIGFHAFPGLIPGGFVGVDVFFVISGFLISGIILQELAENRFSILSFYRRRILRLVPALIVLFLGVLACGWLTLTPSEYQTLGWHTVASALFFQNINLVLESGYFDISADYKPLLHLWSLSIEEQFYLFLPWLLILLARKNRFFVPVTIVSIASLVACLVQTYIYSNPSHAFFWPQYRFWELFVGIQVQLAYRGGHWLSKQGWLSGVGVILIVAGAFCISKFTAHPGVHVLLPVVGASFLLINTSRRGVVHRVLRSPVMVGIGLISYPLYLFHWPLFAFVRMTTASEPSFMIKMGLIVAAFILSFVTYRFVERPIRVTFKSSGRRDFRAITLLIGLIGCVGLGYYVFASEGVPTRPVAVQTQKSVLARFEQGNLIKNRYKHASCGQVRGIDPQVGACLMYGPSTASEAVVVCGDSHAAAWQNVFFKVADRMNVNTIVFGQLGCAPVLDAVRTDGGAFAENCSSPARSRRVVGSIQALKPKHVFLIARWSLYSNGWYVGGQLQPATHFLTLKPEQSANVETSRETLAAKFPETIYALAQVSPVTIVKTMPILKANVESIFYGRATLTTQEEHLNWERFVNEQIDKTIANAPAGSYPISVLDPASLLCVSGTCQTSVGATTMYEDDNHITPQGSMLFESEIEKLIQ